MYKILIMLASIGISFSAQAASEFYSFQAKTAANKDQSMADYNDHVVLVVNVASRCGYTSQYEGLQKLYSTYKTQKFVILGFPSNQFLGQEPGSNEDIQKFCKLSYGVEFPVFAKIDVNGKEQAPLYKWLKSNKGFEGDITWNFNKFLINRKGEVVKRFGSSTKPSEIEKDIKNLLN